MTVIGLLEANERCKKKQKEQSKEKEKIGFSSNNSAPKNFKEIFKKY